ncbi:MAG: amino acid ABC transporter permease [Actinobacteria bacterium]|nr:amino acid ABC transporter permease [Actinomycetota bacterium]
MAQPGRRHPDPHQVVVSRRSHQEGARGALIATTSTVAFLAIATVLVLSSENWPKVREQFFNWGHFKTSWPTVLSGFGSDMVMFVVAMVSISVLALVLAVARSLRGPAFFPIRLLSIVFIDIMRGVPVVLLILLLGFGLPALDLTGLPHSQMFWGLTALTLSYSAYTAEIFRSGIDAVPESQRAAARAIGLTQWQTLRHAILPQAVRNVIPALMNTVVSLQKDVALVSVLGIREAVREAQIYTSRTFNYTSYIAATVLFLAVSIPLVRLVDYVTRKDRERRSQVVRG